ncbi:ABC transporter permease [Paenibacillus sp. D2_2]|uniref:ABC transporter permease n=1 Tax=Paenibacillus sp. D2_2 TaxID=3073092 RepID=UPI0028153028|nr:ABC transporter permease [Paenibacillus sp. D2_2]WMT40367.1 ABC transporter permease [Paenibacillus sp. D2_2]
MSEVQREAMLNYYHLNDSLWEQFLSYIKGIATLDFGLSITYKAPVFDVILVRLPWTLGIVGAATLLSIVLGMIFGLISAWRYPGKIDRGLFLSMLGVSAIPEFIIGMVLLILLAVNFKWFPLGGAETAFLRSEQWFDHVWDLVRHMILPVITLTLSSLASMYLLMRNEAIRIRNEAFVEFAAAKGIGGRAVLMRHIARNSALPLLTMIAIRIGSLLAGSVLVETVFSYPGIGKLLQEAILARDYPLLHGLFLMLTVFVLLLNLLAELIYPYLDPRIRVAHRGSLHEISAKVWPMLSRLVYSDSNIRADDCPRFALLYRRGKIDGPFRRALAWDQYHRTGSVYPICIWSKDDLVYWYDGNLDQYVSKHYFRVARGLLFPDGYRSKCRC